MHSVIPRDYALHFTETISEEPLDVDQLATQLTSLSSQESPTIKSNLLRFAHCAALKEGLKNILTYLHNPEVSTDKKKIIAKKLLEGEGCCVLDYHNRVNNILLEINRPQSIGEILQRIREGIVESVAHNKKDDVHEYNKFLIKASTLGYTVRSINGEEDDYSFELSSNEKNAIRQAFTQKYHPAAVMTALQMEIEHELRDYCDYTGKKPTHSPYQSESVEKIIKFLNKILGTAYTQQDIFIMENTSPTCEGATDINWDFIQDRLWKKLDEEGHIAFSVKERFLMAALYAPDRRTSDVSHDVGAGAGAGVHIREDSSAALISARRAICPQDTISDTLGLVTLFNDHEYLTLLDSLSLHQYPTLIKSTAKRKSLAEALSCHAEKMTYPDLIRYLKLIGVLFVDENPLKNKYLKKLLTSWLRKKGDTNVKALLLELELNDPINIEFFLTVCGLIPLTEGDISGLFPKIRHALLLTLQQKLSLVDNLLKLIQKLNPTDQMTLLTTRAVSNGYHILMLAAECQPDLLPSILTCIKTFDNGLQKELLGTQTTEEGYTALMLAARYHPTALPNLLARIRTFALPLQGELLRKKDAHDWDIFMVATYYQPTALQELLKAINTLKSFDLKKRIFNELLSRKNSDGYSPLMLAASSNPIALSTLLSIITRFSIDPQELFKVKARVGDYNVLMIAIVKKPSCVPPLLDMIRTFNPDLQKEILTTQSIADNKATPLMLAVSYHPAVVPPLLAVINTLPTPIQKEILTVESNIGNAFIIAARSEDGTLSTLFLFIQSLPIEAQKEIIISTLLCSIKSWPILTSKFLGLIARYEFDSQLSILNATSARFSQTIQTYKEELIATRMSTLREGTALQQAIHQQLIRMQFYATGKKEAILIALYHLEKRKPPETPLDTAIYNALDDSTSDLYKALNIKRFSLFKSTSRARCLDEILAARERTPALTAEGLRIGR
jgi:hypothetical protein